MNLLYPVRAGICSLIALLGVSSAGAQLTPEPQRLSLHETPQTNAPFSQPASLRNPARHAKTSVRSKRLLAKSKLVGEDPDTLRPQDSTRYRYSGTRGTGSADTVTLYPLGMPGMRVRQEVSRYDSRDHRTEIVALQSRNGDGVLSPIGRTRYFADENLVDTLTLHDMADPHSGTFLPRQAIRDVRDRAGRQTELSYSTWNRNTQQFELTGRNLTTYNAAGQKTEYTTEVRKTGGGMRGTSRTRYTYSPSGKVLTEKYERAPYETWILVELTESGYDASDNLIRHEISSYFDNGSVSYRQIREYSYDAANRMLSSTDSSLLPNGAINGVDKILREYDEKGNRVSQRHYTHRGGIETYADSVRMEYDGLNLTRSTTFVLVSGNWAPTFRASTTRSADGLDSSVITESYHPVQGNFVPEYRTRIVRNAEGLLALTSFQNWDGTDWVYNSGSYEERFYYDDYEDGWPAPGNGGLNAENIRIFPVPARTMVNVRIALEEPEALRIALIDAAGRNCGHWDFSQASAALQLGIPTDGLNSGIYFLQVKAADRVVTRRFAIARD